MQEEIKTSPTASCSCGCAGPDGRGSRRAEAPIAGEAAGPRLRSQGKPLGPRPRPLVVAAPQAAVSGLEGAPDVVLTIAVGQTSGLSQLSPRGHRTGFRFSLELPVLR